MTGILVGLQDESLRPHTAAIEVQHNALAVPARIGLKVHNRCTDKKGGGGRGDKLRILQFNHNAVWIGDGGDVVARDATEIENNPCPPGSSTDADVRHPFGGLPTR